MRTRRKIGNALLLALLIVAIIAAVGMGTGGIQHVWGMTTG
jgi:hypothetical protein